MKYIRIFLLIVVCGAVLAVGTWCLLGWIVSRSFRVATAEPSFQQLSDVLQASVGGTLTRGDIRFRPNTTTGAGAMAFYSKNPQALQQDKQYFKTWSSALFIANTFLKGRRVAGWASSESAAEIGRSEKTDSWGHPFCIRVDAQRAVVVSAGPKAIGSLDCTTLNLSDSELSQMAQGRLNPHASGGLILILNKANVTGQYLRPYTPKS